MLVWDPSKSAQAHSALAGVLAGIVLAVLAILLQGEATAVESRKSQHRERLNLVFKQLILALFMLTVSAVVWGGLSGQPSAGDIADVLPRPEEQGTTASPSPGSTAATLDGGVDAATLETLRSVVRAARAMEMIVATSAVIPLAIGALLFAASIMTLIPTVMNEQASSLTTYVGRAFALLATLGAYEMTFFAWSAVRVCFPASRLPHPSLGSFLTAILVGMAILPAGRPRWREQGIRAIRKVAGQRDGGYAANAVAIGAVLVGTTGYVLVPSADYATGPEPFSRWHETAAVAVGIGGVLGAAFAIVASWTLFAPMGTARTDPPSDTE